VIFHTSDGQQFHQYQQTERSPLPQIIYSIQYYTIQYILFQYGLVYEHVSILYCCNCRYNYECIFVIAPRGTLIGIKYIVLYSIVCYK
jgi:hypothetical protein